MAQRGSGYARITGDTYVTPRWVYDALFAVEPRLCWGIKDVAPPEPERNGYDFLVDHEPRMAVVTNPPFGLSDDFVQQALKVTEPLNGIVAMLLPVTWDCAKSRVPLFLPPFKCKYILTRRIRWENLAQAKAGPSTNHAWYVWEWGRSANVLPYLGWLK